MLRAARAVRPLHRAFRARACLPRAPAFRARLPSARLPSARASLPRAPPHFVWSSGMQCLGASGAELRGLFEAMSMTGTMASLFRLTCDPAIAEVKVTYKACVVIALVRGWSPIVLCMRGCLPYICTISACISHESSIVLPINRTQCVYLPYCQ